MKIKVEKPDNLKLEKLNVKNWPIWSKEKSIFDWEYDSEEVCYIIKGRAIVTTEDGEKVSFGAGDLVTFPKGLKCKWEILENIKKHYKL